MLDRGAQSGHDQRHRQHRRTPWQSHHQKAQPGHCSAADQQNPLAGPLGQDPDRHLQNGQGDEVQGDQESQLRAGHGQNGLPDRQQDVQHVGQSVVKQVAGADGQQDSDHPLR